MGIKTRIYMTTEDPPRAQTGTSDSPFLACFAIEDYGGSPPTS